MRNRKSAFLIIAALLVFTSIAAAGCVVNQGEVWTPQITQLTDYDDYNLYLADYTAGDYHLDDLLSENITDPNTLKKRIAELAAPGQNITLNLPSKVQCTVFLADGGNDFLFGRNFDLQDTNCMIVHTKPANGYESFAFAHVGMLNKGANSNPENAVNALLSPYASMDGMNAAGVAIAVNEVDGSEICQERGKPVINAPLIIRVVLDKAANVDEAVKLLDNYDARMIKGYQFLIADKSGDSAVINYINNEMVVTRGEKLMTNFYLCDIPDDYPAGHGQDRYETAKNKLEEKNYNLDSADALDVLNSVQQTPETGGQGTTQWSVVYHLKEGFADIVLHRHWDDVLTYGLGKTVPAALVQKSVAAAV